MRRANPFRQRVVGEESNRSRRGRGQHMNRQGATKHALDGVSILGILRARIGLLIGCLLLIGINRAAGLVLPYLSKYLVADVIIKQSQTVLVPLVLTVAAAALAQGLTSYWLTLSMNISAQRLIANLRKQVHEHVSRLSMTYYDANRTGVLVN